MRRSLQLLVVLILVATACAEIERTVSGARALDGDWILTSGRDGDGGFELSPRSKITLALDGESLAGVAACNEHGGAVDVDDNQINADPMNVTAMHCSGDRVMELEARYLDALEAVETYDLEDDVLTLSGPETELTYEQVPPVANAPLTGIDWRLESLLHGVGMEGTASSPQPAHITFGGDGTFEGTTGCREISGRWEDKSDRIETSEIELGAGRCRGLKAEQDEHLVSVLEAGFTVEIEENTMTLSWDEGERGLYYVVRE